MAAVPEETRNAALEAIADALMTNKAAIMEENAKAHESRRRKRDISACDEASEI